MLIAKIWESSELKGLKGDDGETFCVFLKDLDNVFASGWKWFFTKEEAKKFAEYVKNFAN
jgi:hypothetical protein